MSPIFDRYQQALLYNLRSKTMIISNALQPQKMIALKEIPLNNLSCLSNLLRAFLTTEALRRKDNHVFLIIYNFFIATLRLRGVLLNFTTKSTKGIHTKSTNAFCVLCVFAL
jgi:hypothetical protein